MADGIPPLLRMENISKSYGGVRALQDVQFTAERGRIHALLDGSPSTCHFPGPSLAQAGTAGTSGRQ